MVGSRLLLALLFPTSKQKALAERESPGARESEGRHPAVPQCLSLPLSLGRAGGGGGWLEELLVRLGSYWDPWGKELAAGVEHPPKLQRESGAPWQNGLCGPSRLLEQREETPPTGTALASADPGQG